MSAEDRIGTGGPSAVPAGTRFAAAWRRRDLTAPAAADAQAAVGDAWWDLGQSREAFREALLRRAYVWYNRALPAAGPKEAKRVADRTAELCRRYPDLTSAWDQLDVSQAAPVGDFFVRQKPGQAKISMKESSSLGPSR